jgi:thioredoxin 1
MNKNTKIILGIVLMIVIFGIIVLAKQDDAMMDKEMDNSEVVQKDDTIQEDEMMKKEETEMMDEEIEKSDLMMKGSYEAYSPEKLARAETGDVVLFFHASWCPSCRSLNSDIEKNISSIPEGLSILKVDYDKETELKKKYGITYQHTLVQVDKGGDLIKKWSGSPTLTSLVSQIQ